MILDIILGIIGAIVGGFLFVQFGAVGVTGFNLYSMLVAIVGAVVVLLVYHAVSGRRRIGPDRGKAPAANLGNAPRHCPQNLTSERRSRRSPGGRIYGSYSRVKGHRARGRG